MDVLPTLVAAEAHVGYLTQGRADPWVGFARGKVTPTPG
jgi:hypothetical protein